MSLFLVTLREYDEIAHDFLSQLQGFWQELNVSFAEYCEQKLQRSLELYAMGVVDEDEYGLREISDPEGIAGESEFAVGSLEGGARGEIGLRLGSFFK